MRSIAEFSLPFIRTYIDVKLPHEMPYDSTLFAASLDGLTTSGGHVLYTKYKGKVSK